MTITDLLTQTVTVQTHGAGAADEYGNATDTWSAGVQHKGRVEQRNATEITVDGDVQRSDWLLFLGPEVAIGGRDRVTADGRTFEVVGPPSVARTPRGPHHLEANLRHVSG